MQTDQQFVEMIVKAIVDSPDQVKTERTVDEMGVLITLWVAPDDMSKIIGKEGRTAKALRTLLRVLGAKNNSRVNLKIDEPAGSTHEHQDHATTEAMPNLAVNQNDHHQADDQVEGQGTEIL